MVDIFADLRPIKGSDDPRITTLESLHVWFLRWEGGIEKSQDLSKKDKKRAIMTTETRDHTQSVLHGFVAMCRNHFKVSTVSVVPGRVNSDIVENLFCQQRALCHGSNDNPSHELYSNSLNTIILSQAPISRKSNAFGSCEPMKSQPAKKAKLGP